MALANVRLEYCGSFQVTAEGQSMFALRQGGDYTIEPGDILSNIAARYRIPVIELFRKNPQLTDANTIVAGQKLNLN